MYLCMQELGHTICFDSIMVLIFFLWHKKYYITKPANIIAFTWMYHFYVPSAFLRNNGYILSKPKLLGRWGLYPFSSIGFFSVLFSPKYFLSLKIYTTSNRIIKWIQYCYKVFVFVLEQLFTYHEILPVLPVFIGCFWMPLRELCVSWLYEVTEQSVCW